MNTAFSWKFCTCENFPLCGILASFSIYSTWTHFFVESWSFV